MQHSLEGVCGDDIGQVAYLDGSLGRLISENCLNCEIFWLDIVIL